MASRPCLLHKNAVKICMKITQINGLKLMFSFMQYLVQENTHFLKVTFTRISSRMQSMGVVVSQTSFFPHPFLKLQKNCLVHFYSLYCTIVMPTEELSHQCTMEKNNTEPTNSFTPSDNGLYISASRPLMNRCQKWPALAKQGTSYQRQWTDLRVNTRQQCRL